MKGNYQEEHPHVAVRKNPYKTVPEYVGTVENKGGYQMKCPRCGGLMVRDHFYDPDGPFLRIETLRCLNCGETVYPKAAKQSAGLGSGKPASQAA